MPKKDTSTTNDKCDAQLTQPNNFSDLTAFKV